MIKNITSKIAFIAPYEEIYITGNQVIADLGLSSKIVCYLGSLNKGVEVARQAEREGVEVIVSRGGTAEFIMHSAIKIPVVEISITIEDLAQALVSAKKLTGLDKPRIAVAAFKNMIYDIEVFSKFMDVNLFIYRFHQEEQIMLTIEQAIADKIDVLIGGIETTKMAAERGLKTILLASGKAAFQAAFLQAEKLTYARKIEKDRLQKFRILVDYSIQGIIGVDCDKKINVFNGAAEKLLNCDAQKVVGENIAAVFPELADYVCISETKKFIGEIIEISNKKVIANIVPIDGETSVREVMITFEDVGQIVELEARIRKENFTKGLVTRYTFADIWGASSAIENAKLIAKDYAGIDSTVLITGPSGTGKELFAQSIHNLSKRRHCPFVAINCAAIPANLLESELFGYVEGAFTGANRKGKTGLFELAHGGSIFLDEIGEMEQYAQISLLRVIQERRVMRLGDNRYLPIDVRIIAATNQNLYKRVQEGAFRADLYYRLNVLPLELPALANRAGDAAFIAERFLDVYGKQFHKTVVLDESAKQYLSEYHWPGNIRELQNFIERLVVVTKARIVKRETVERFLNPPNQPLGNNPLLMVDPVIESAEESEKATIIKALQHTHYNQKEAAKLLGINRSTLYRKLKIYCLTVKKSCIM
jgi:transcriptional regulator with PAS, ATPase and Fis domain